MWDLIVPVPDHCLSFYFQFPSPGQHVDKTQRPFLYCLGYSQICKSHFSCSFLKNYLSSLIFYNCL